MPWGPAHMIRAVARGSVGHEHGGLTSPPEHEHIRDAGVRHELASARTELMQRERDLEQVQRAVVRREQALSQFRERIATLESELANAQRAIQRTTESVTWQAFQRARAQLYRAIGGERSMVARLLGAWLRFVGRWLRAREPGARARPAEEVIPHAAGAIALPRYADPYVSLIIPVHSHAE